MKYFKEYNCNPKNKDNGDCGYRALSLFLNKTWEEIAEIDMEFYLETGISIVESVYDSKVIPGEEFYFKKYHPEIIKKPFPENKTIRDFIDSVAEKNKVYYFNLGDHATVVKNKKVWDTWDCSNYMPKYYYERCC